MSKEVIENQEDEGFGDFAGPVQRIIHNIPSSFELWGQTIRVEFDPAVHHNEGVYGWANYRLNKIILQSRSEQTPISKDLLLHNFLHEVIHFVLYCAGEDDFNPPLHKREYLVDRIAGSLHQAIKTMKWDEDIMDHPTEELL